MIFDHVLFLPFCVLFYRVVIDDIRPCIISAIASDHNQTCTAKEKHDLILTFRDSIKQHLQFDVIQCKYVM